MVDSEDEAIDFVNGSLTMAYHKAMLSEDF